MDDGDSPVSEKGGLSPAPTTSHRVRHTQRAERSCLMCHQRKIRCDKKVPCSHCARADILCCYPPLGRPTRRPQKTTIAEVAARLARLERTITAMSNGASSQADTNSDAVSTVNPHHDPEVGMNESQTAIGSSGELIVQGDYSSRYFNEALFSQVLEEEQELQSLIGNASPKNDRERSSASFDIGGLLSSFNQSVADSHSYHPSRWHAMKLWQAFVANVDPVVKVLHIPTAQATVYAAINNATPADHDLNALLFSIYFGATTSLSSSDAANLLGQSKTTALNTFKQGLERSLARANFLDTPSMRSLQAMTIYLTCLRAYNGGRAVWTLNGLVIRSAQSIGLHRDGTHFNLTPFESEMRRRLWWYMCSQDSRAAEDHGITLEPSDGYSDTLFPSNLDDSDILPDVQDLPTEKVKWTEITFSLSMIKICHTLQQLHQESGGPLNPETGESTRRQILNSLRSQLEEMYLKHCDPNIPIQQLALLTTRLRLAKVEFLNTYQWLSRRDSGKEDRTYRRTSEEALVTACDILETDLRMRAEDLFQSFRWFTETFVQYYVLTYVLWHLCVNPVGPSVERAWKAIEGSFEVTQRHKKNVATEQGSMWAVLQRLRDKAIRIRDHTSSETAADFMTVDSGPQGPCSGMDMFTAEFGDANSGLTFGDGMNWDMNTADLPDWSNFVGKFEVRANEL